MKNEEAMVYSVDCNDTDSGVTALTDARIRLVGHEAPTVQIHNRKALEDYCRKLVGDCAMEEFHIICVNAQCQVICDSCISMGSLSEVSAYPRNIAAVAILSNAHSVFLAHNHPGGTCAPSREDLTSTLQIKKALDLFGISVLDHMIVTAASSYSMRQHADF